MTRAQQEAPLSAQPPHLSRRGKVTIRQVAAAAGVSRATASRVISGSTLVSDNARAAVETAIAELGFTPSAAARSLALGRSDAVALVLPEPNSRVLTDPFFARIILGLSSCLEEEDQQLVLLIARPGEGAGRITRYLEAGHVDGAIIASHHRDDSLNSMVVHTSLPCVFIGRPLGVSNAHYVDMDNVSGARLATDHLIATGHKRIATIAGPQDMTAGVDRLQGWRQAMRAAGLPDDAVAYGDFTQEGGREAARLLLERHPDVDAIFVASDLMAAAALSELAGHGRRAPGDVAIIGFDDFDIAQSTDPPLSTIAHPVTEMADKAGGILLDLLAGNDRGNDPVLYAPQLVLRTTA